jgi:TatA/E family protein of Tat protein translocase
MFGIGMPEMILILAIALVVIGPKKLPDLAKSLGRAMREFKKATNEFKETMHIDSEMEDVKKAFSGISDDVKEAVDLNLEPDKKTDAASRADGAEKGKNETQKVASESDDFDNLKNLKDAFDDLGANSSAVEETTTEDQPAPEEGQKVKQKGSDDDA